MTDKTHLVIAVGERVPAYSCFIAPVRQVRVVRGAVDEEDAALAVKGQLASEFPGAVFREFDVVETTRVVLDGGPLGACLVADGPR